MFENLIKITRPVDASESKNSIIFEEFSGTFISVKKIKSKRLLPQFLRDLEDLNGKLEVLLTELYQSGEGGKLQQQYDKVLLNLKNQQSKLNYLSSFFETTTTKVEAAQKKVIECEKKLIEDEERKKNIENRIERLRTSNRKNNTFSLSPWPLPNWNANIRQEGRSTLTIKSPVESQVNTENSNDSVFANDDDDEEEDDEENWSDFADDLD